MKLTLREEAKELRAEGWSYSIIQEKLGVAKSTLSNWLSNIPYSANAEVRSRIKAGPIISGEHRQASKKLQTTEIWKKSDEEIGLLSTRDIFLLGIGLYMGS